ncbi:hypothetical protein DB43_DI00050 [Parachlamydia acanthamoebae]|uniref:Uncharacterized protein n=1 Tax=Parachlamydia acanthamoebae TaxID=83552 RepID=A0A0C1ERP1_9BACT|nr:hypothetical protein DB43_DI00050 [Parachlamydia acanthamoebae]
MLKKRKDLFNMPFFHHQLLTLLHCFSTTFLLEMISQIDFIIDEQAIPAHNFMREPNFQNII